MNFFNKLRTLITDKTLRNKILFVIGILFLFRLLASVPVPGVDTSALAKFLEGNQLLGFFNVLSGGGLSTFSVVMLGVGAYITRSIIMQLLCMMYPSIKEMMQENGEAGLKKFNQYSRLLSVPIGFVALEVRALYRRHPKCISLGQGYPVEDLTDSDVRD